MQEREAQRQAIIDYCRKNEFFSGIKNLDKNVDAWLDAHPIDILKEIKRLNAYLVSSGRRYRNYAQFVNNNLGRAAGPPVMRPASVNEVLAKIGKALDIKKGLKTSRPDEQARIRELQRQAQIILERENKS